LSNSSKSGKSTFRLKICRHI